MKLPLRGAPLVVLLLVGSPARADVQVTVDATRRHQTMEGFGCTHNALVYEGSAGDTLGPLRPAVIQAVYGQVGITMGNVGIGALESTGGWNGQANDNADPSVFNPAGFDWNPSTNVKQSLLDLAGPCGFSNYYFAGNVTTRWANQWLGAMRTTDYNQYLAEAAEQVAAGLVHWRDTYGIVQPYHMLFNEPLSGNNELRGASTPDVVNLVETVGQRLRAEGFADIKFVVPAEETEQNSLDLASAILADPQARPFVGAIAYHAYPYGSTYASVPQILATSGAGAPVAAKIAVRNQLRDLGAQYGLPVWMTEVSHGEVDPRSFDDLRGRAIHVHDELEYADAAAYFGMNNMWDTTSQQLHFGNTNLYSEEGTIALVENATGLITISGMGRAIGHYARWVHRGAVRVESATSDPLVQVSAFVDDPANQLVVVLINNESVPETVAIDLAGLGLTRPPRFIGEQSTASAYWSPLAPFVGGSATQVSITLPALSVTTIASPRTTPDDLAGSLRVADQGAGPSLTLVGVPAGVQAVRFFRGAIGLLPQEYSHHSPFSGQAGDPECSQAPGAAFIDSNAFRDGNDYYYLAVTLANGVEGDFGSSSLGVPRTRPEDSPTDLVTTCP